MKPSPLIDTWGQTRKALLYMNWAVQNLGPFESVLDIGAGDGIAADVLPAGVTYSGVDIGADIYSRAGHVKYIENFDKLRAEIALHQPVDLITIFDVLEHTTDFTTLFHDGARNARKYVFVSLPNEMNIDARVRFLFGKLELPHGLNLLEARPGHKHQWLVSFASARDVLYREAANLGFTPTHQVFIRNLPQTRWKRWLVRGLEIPFPDSLKAHGIGFAFKRDSQ